MKKTLICIFIALFTAVCVFVGCNQDGAVREPVDPTPIEQETGDFTVTLVLDGKVYVPRGEVTATWDDGFSRPVTAKFGSDGVARASGLDGDYVVRVDGLPSEYAFDPNNNVATNYNRKIRFNIYTAAVMSGFHSDATDDRILYDAVELKVRNPDFGGAFRLTLNSPFETYYMFYQPTKAGMYSVKSLINITDNDINPKYQICSGTRFGARYLGAIVDGGGASSTYTVNFDYQTGFNYDELQGILIFGVSAEMRTLEFPVTFDILVKRTGEYQRQDILSNVVIAEEFANVKPDAEYRGEAGYISASEFRAKQNEFMRGPNMSTNFKMFFKDKVLDGTKVAFNEATGYYHLYDEATGEYGAVVCAKITSTCGILDDAFNAVEYRGNKALTFDDNYDKFYKKTPPKYGSDKDPHYLNYKVFIEGFAGISSHELSFPGITAQYSAYAGVYGYADFANDSTITGSDGISDGGCYPVTKELQRFLQGYATSQRLFRDGNGWAETDSRNPLMSAEEDQWLFACGYYVQ